MKRTEGLRPDERTPAVLFDGRFAASMGGSPLFVLLDGRLVSVRPGEINRRLDRSGGLLLSLLGGAPLASARWETSHTGGR